ncbi:phospholipase A2 inhibitor and Ly6/PLAUR domain-containing protein-like [Polyodon spathula]|uniref:phospholipase A2 inhibitor and Ly6/PLAUR domain-containing protein-like n=1 Tax=Polyodon spathula TaxID=7913 RepID=UPI001B7E4AE4|nr:phospholipase A2 inhibitor and Ly6/PLAUR domain-containing protein-like [Polyodon spathula]
MGQLLLALCTICALLSAVNSLSCNSCSGKTSCSSTTSQTCSSSQACLTISTASSFQQYGFTPNGFTKKCGPLLQNCNQLLSAKFTDKLRVEARIDCCETNKCNKGSYNVAGNSSNFNGKKCPSCASTGNCGTGMVQCVGTQDQCITMTGRGLQGAAVTLKGCATKNICDHYSLTTVWPFWKNLQVTCVSPKVNPLSCNTCSGTTSCSSTTSQTCSSSQACLTISRTSTGLQQFG